MTTIWTASRRRGRQQPQRLFEEDGAVWGRKYPAIAQSWRRNWEQVIPFFAFPVAVRRIIYTTDEIDKRNLRWRVLYDARERPRDEARRVGCERRQASYSFLAGLRRKLAVLCWHVLTKERDYLWARPALVANKMRALELQAGLPQKKGNQRGPAYAYNAKALRDQELTLAQQAERSYARFVDRWKTRAPRGEVRERATATAAI